MSINFIIPLLIIFGSLLIRVPVAYGMIASALTYFLMTPGDPGQVVHLMGNGIFNNYVYLAVPLFMFTANVMNSGEITDRIFKFANGLVGRFRGGTGYVNVLASLIFSGMTGSAVADAAGLGIMEIDQMRREGYDDGFASALTASTAVIGPIFPPSVPMVIYAMVSGASIGALFMGGMIPAFIIAGILALYVGIMSKKRNYPRGAQVTRKEFIKDSFYAIPALLTPVILLVGIYTGVMTPTEAGAVAAAYSLIISILIYRSLGWKTLWNIIKETGKSVGQVGLVVCAAYGFSYVVANEKIAVLAADFVLGLTDNKYVFLLIVNVAFLIMGMFLDTSTMQLIFLPLLLPIVTTLGIDLVHFGVVCTLNMMIGLMTPPYGMLLFVTAGVSKTPMKEIIKEIMPMIGLEIAVLILITYVPSVITFIPSVLLG
ncbi:MAG: TRAP transporter large permease [Oscillospiraceae bacterium]|nr:TRAP transporter large permease [Oscillospiraceae bacterium]